MHYLFETERLKMRELRVSDESDMAHILLNKHSMRYYDRIFTEMDVKQWIEKNLRRYQEDGFGSGKLTTIKPDEALEEALCFGWIDGQMKRIDDTHYIKKFTPRRKGSAWSERNRNLIKILIENGKMTEYGLAAIEHAKQHGTWETPKREPISEEQIDLLIQALSGAEKALKNFLHMPLSVQRTYTAHYLDAKKEDTRKKRLEHIIERLNAHQKPM